MSERERQRWLSVKNRLEELAARHGPSEDEPLPVWLDSLEGFYAHVAATSSSLDVEEVAREPPLPRRVLRVSEALKKLDQYGETPVYECEICGEESAKASAPLGLWHCTACDYWGRIKPAGFKPTHIEQA